MTHYRLPPLFIIAVLLAGCAGSRPEGLIKSAPGAWKTTAASIAEELSAPQYYDAVWAVQVYNLDANEPVFAWNRSSNMIPASNTKLYTTAAALDQLGPDYRYTTRVLTDGSVTDSTLTGNLFIIGSGDPVIGGRFNDGDILATFRAWADSLRSMGITRIDGDIIGDDDFFDDVPLGPGWMWDDESYWYSAQVGALSFNDNCIDLTIAGTEPGELASLSWEPANTNYVAINNKTLTLHPDSSLDNRYYRERASNTIVVGSEIPADLEILRSITVSNPTLYFVSVLRETFEREGIQVSGFPVDIDDLDDKPMYSEASFSQVASHVSVPMSEIVKAINKPSQNLYADMVLKTIGAEANADPGSWSDGITQASETFGRAGADTSRINLVDGSGLSRYNLVDTDMTMSLLHYMWDHEDRRIFSAFYESLPIGGIDGTLENRYPDGLARGNVHAKTGTVSHASSLSGYVATTDGTPLAFVIMANHFSIPTSRVRQAQDRIVEQLANMQLNRR